MECTFLRPEKDTLRIDEAAAWLGITAATIKWLVRRGMFPRPRKLNRSQPAYWTAEDLAAIRPLLGRFRPDRARKNGEKMPQKKKPKKIDPSVTPQ